MPSGALPATGGEGSPATEMDRGFPALPALAGVLLRTPAGGEIDHSVPRSTLFRGGRKQAEFLLDLLPEHGLSRYARDQSQPTAHATSNLGPHSVPAAFPRGASRRRMQPCASANTPRAHVQTRGQLHRDSPIAARHPARTSQRQAGPAVRTRTGRSSRQARRFVDRGPKRICGAAGFTAIIECIGARRSPNGRARSKKPCHHALSQ